MSWIIIRIYLEDNKVKVEWIYLRKFVLNTVQGDRFLYILLEFGYKYSFDCYNVSFSILRSSSSRFFFPFILPSSFHFYPPRLRQIADIDPYPISTFLKSLVVAVRLKITIQVSLPH